MAALSLTGVLVASSAAPASAACVSTYKSTDGNNPNRSFAIASNSTCNDLNIRQAAYGQYYRGEWKNGSSWVAGAAGWKYRSPSTSTLAVVISNIANTTTVRMTGWSVASYAWAVH